MAAQQSEAADGHRRRLALIQAGALLAVRNLWSRVSEEDVQESWAAVTTPFLAVLMAAQTGAARESLRYVPEVLAEQGIRDSPVAQVDIRSVVGRASSGVPLDDLVDLPALRVTARIAQGAPVEDAMQSGESLLDGIVQTQTMDAAREIESVEVAVRPDVKGTVRCLQLPSCARCVILAGRWYRWSEGFKRHPNCDCFHIPTGAADSAPLHPLATDPMGAVRAGQVRGLSKQQREDIDGGADLNRVVNVKRKSVQTAAESGGRRRGTRRRPTPEQIYQRTSGRKEAVKVLEQYGYVAL